jgi:hypothetical protein
MPSQTLALHLQHGALHDDELEFFVVWEKVVWVLSTVPTIWRGVIAGF